MAERKAVTKEMLRRYARGSKGDKGRVLDELCALTEWNRDHARRALRQAGRGPGPSRAHSVRPVRYGPDLQAPLEKVWATFGGLCGKRLAPFMAEGIEALERFGELELASEQREGLIAMSAATVDRRLAPARNRLGVKGRSGTKPGTLLKHHIPIRTFAQWDERKPGFLQIDLVAHDGGVAAGDYCQSLDATDVATGWTEPAALKNKAQVWVFAELKRVRSVLPFPLLGMDSDNGAEFINDELYRYCLAEEITFTRGRAYRKNDSCFVEQKNWTVVRQHVGYARYDTAEELEVLTELYSHLRLWVNHFQPVMMLAEKIRDGAKVTRRYDTARTPYRRVLASEHVSKAAKRKLEAEHLKLNPAQLQRDIGRCQYELLRLGRFKEHRRRKEARAATTGSASDGSSRAAVTAQDRVGPLPAGASRKRGSQRRAEARSGKR
jgi:hypothetical protein